MFNEIVTVANTCSRLLEVTKELIIKKDEHFKQLNKLCESYPENIPTECIRELLGISKSNSTESNGQKKYYVVEWVEYNDRYGGGTHRPIFDGEGTVKLFHKSMDIVDYVEYLRLQPQHFHKRLYIYDSEHDTIMKVSTFKKSLKKDEK